MELAGRSWQQMEDRSDALLAVPIGSTEQHGPHLPLGTDTTIAEALARELARRRPGVVVAPAIAYGSSGEHAGFPGTLSVGLDALAVFLLELGRSATATFDRVLLVSAHGGNATAVNEAVRVLRYERRDVRAWEPHWRGDAHAGCTETSVMLVLAPGDVRRERAEAGNTAPLSDVLSDLQAHGVRMVSKNGVLGDPTLASAAAGRRLLAEAVESLTGFVDHWVRLPVEHP